MLPNLRDLFENPPSINVSVGPDILEPLNDPSRLNPSSLSASNMLPDAEIAAKDDIDWNISVDNTEIDWEIGTIEQANEPANDFGSYEIVNTSVDMNASVADNGRATDHTVLNKAEDGPILEIPTSEIRWDISIENPQVDMVEDAGVPDPNSESQLSVPNPFMPNENIEERSQLLDTEYRNRVLDDLFEVFYNFYSFLFVCAF